MPSPIGHAMAGLIVALAGEKARGRGLENQAALRVPWTLFLVCMFLAALPDIDHVYMPIHRGPTHSIGATVIVLLVAAGVTRWTTGRIRWRIAVVCALAYFSHIVMDWLGEDPTIRPGVKALWPISDRLFMSGWDIFRRTERFEPLAPVQIAHNLRTLLQEVILLGPLLIWLLWRRTKTTGRT